MKRVYTGILGLGLVLGSGLSACDSDDGDGGTSDPKCVELAARCHPFDQPGDELGTLCHEIGHDNEVEQCIERYDECLAHCVSLDAGPDASEADPKCVELAARCHPFDHGEEGELGHVCHEIGHENAVDECAEKYDECLAFCVVDAGADAQSSAPDAAESICEVIGSVCHDLDDGGNPLAHECHETGHGGDVALCQAIYPQCIALCDPANAGDAGLLLCEEIGAKCHPFDAGLGHDCHEVGHAGDVAACAAIYGQCMSFCSTDSGAD